MIVAGIDPSLSSSGVVVGDSSGQPKVFRIKGAKIGDSPWARIERCRRMVGGITEAVQNNGAERVFIEGYAFGAKFHREELAELGGLLRDSMLRIDKKLREVQPASLKQFVTGKGNAKKHVMILAIRDQWGFETTSNDEADAYGLWKLGLCVTGEVEADGLHQIEAVQKVIEGPTTQREKKKQRRKKKTEARLF